MAVQLFSGTMFGSGVQVAIAPGDDVYVFTNATILSSDGTAMTASDGNHRVTIAGTVHGHTRGIALGDSETEDTGLRVTVQTGGKVTSYSDNALYVRGGGARTENFGTIGSDMNRALYMYSDGGVTVNHGTMFTQAVGIYAVEFFSIININPAKLINYGTISGIDLAIRGDLDFDDTIQNFGTINGDIEQLGGNDRLVNIGLINGIVSTEGGTDTVDNRGGTIMGDVLLGVGADLYDGRGGSVRGTIFGADGDDRFLLNSLVADVVDGGTGRDTLDFRSQSGAVVALDGSFENGGSAMGDSYVDIDTVFGSGSSADLLRGNAGNNALFGYGGDDRLQGMDGTDTLRGGLGADNLTGGRGSDTFQYNVVEDFGDQINDFSSSGPAGDDRFVFTASALGGGLSPGALAAAAFGTGSDLATMDADDRFFFRTTDRTLWFDADGNGAASVAAMVADLQASATVVVADIVVI